MHAIKLKDGTLRHYDAIVTGLEIAASISPRLAREAVAVRVNGALKDLALFVPAIVQAPRMPRIQRMKSASQAPPLLMKQARGRAQQ